jgi:hypothetical protein
MPQNDSLLKAKDFRWLSIKIPFLSVGATAFWIVLRLQGNPIAVLCSREPCSAEPCTYNRFLMLGDELARSALSWLHSKAAATPDIPYLRDKRRLQWSRE